MRLGTLRSRSMLLAAATGFVFFSLNQLSGFAAIRDVELELPEDYLSTEFDWSMLVFRPDVRDRLNYPGSALHPMTKVSVRFSEYHAQGASKSTPYEDFWYKEARPLGLRRHKQLNLQKDSDGTIIICPKGKASDGDSSGSVADALVRLMIDVHMRGGETSLVLVPDAEYQEIGHSLKRFGLLPERLVSEAQTYSPFSFRLRSYPDGEDELFYLVN